ncbi:hypothetical protein N7488_006684 [Penicillium malachiteum]|nr:hypothetical protein N7488_006684 [Penicillium malachiteum]
MDAGTPGLRSVETIHRTGQACVEAVQKEAICAKSLLPFAGIPKFPSEEQRFVQLQEELARCQQLLESEKAQNGALKSELSQQQADYILTRKGLAESKVG